MPDWLKTKAEPDVVLSGGFIGIAARPPLAANVIVPMIGEVGVPDAMDTLPADSTETIKDVT